MPRKRGIPTEEYLKTIAVIVGAADQREGPLPPSVAADHLDSAMMSAVYAILPELKSQDFAHEYIVRARTAFRRQLRDRVLGPTPGRRGTPA